MQQPTTVSRIGAWLMLFARGASWIGVLAYFALFAGASFAISALVTDPDTAFAIAGRFTFLVASIVQYGLWALIALFLARRLGDGPAQTGWLVWLLLAIAYFIVGIVPPGLAQGFIAGWLQNDPQLIFPVTTGFTLFWNAAVFPLLVWLMAAAHGARGFGFRGIATYLAERGFGLWALYIVLLLASLLLDLAVTHVLGGEASTTAGLLVSQFAAALRTAATVLFAIAAWREIAPYAE